MTEPTILHNDPKVFTIDNFLTNEEKVHKRQIQVIQ